MKSTPVYKLIVRLISGVRSAGERRRVGAGGVCVPSLPVSGEPEFPPPPAARATATVVTVKATILTFAKKQKR